MEATSDREDTNWPRVLNVVGLVAVVILAAIGANTFRSNSPRNQPDTSLGVSLKSRLDASLGSGQWFAYPDNNPHAIGIKRVPKRFKVDAPLLSVQNDDGTTERGDVVLREGGAHAQLDTPLTTADIPEWQIEAWLAWRQAQRADTKGIGLSPENLDRMFGPSNWRRNPSYSFSAIVDKLQNELRIEYPITSVDADNQKFGVGSPPVRAGLGATVWLAGKIPRVLVPNEISKSFLYPQGAGALQREGTAYTTTLDLTRINRPNAGLCWDFGRPLDIHNEGPFTFMLRTDTAAPVELTFECLGCEGDERMSVVMRDLEAGSFEPITVPTDQLKVGVLRALSRICVALDKKNPSTPSRATVALKMVYVD